MATCGPPHLFTYHLLLLITLTTAQTPADCSRNGYDRCVRIADPLVKEPHLVFPDNADDIDLVCRTWNRFVDCLKYYTDNCFSEQQRRQFNKAVENPIESVHQMCTQPEYQKEYLRYAPCIKSTITQRIHCGTHYSLLVDQVSQGDIISKSTLCCSHDRFKTCVASETRRLCDRGVPEGPAARFSAHIIDKALSFLQDQCFNYIPNSGDCLSTSTTDSQFFTDPLTISTSSSEVYPWSTIQQLDNMAAKEIFPSRVTPPQLSTTTPWLPSSSSSQVPSENTMLGSRTRPASYGRSSWSSSSQNSLGNTAPQDTPSSTTPSSRPDWATMASTRAQEPVKGTTWYPAAGDQLVNEVDEPNQQGWAKPRNGQAGPMGLSVVVVTVIVTIVAVFLGL